MLTEIVAVTAEDGPNLLVRVGPAILVVLTLWALTRVKAKFSRTEDDGETTVTRGRYMRGSRVITKTATVTVGGVSVTTEMHTRPQDTPQRPAGIARQITAGEHHGWEIPDLLWAQIVHPDGSTTTITCDGDPTDASAVARWRAAVEDVHRG